MLMIEFERGDTMKKFDTYIVNKIFTVPYLDRMISEDSIPDSFFECVRRYVKTDDATIGEAISEIYHFMNYEYRNEYYYKNTILNQLLIKKHDLYNAAALTELPIGNSKADFIMINDRGVVYEIKTDLDNLIRLENQLKDYYPPLLELIKESNGEMLFVDPDDERFSKKELERMMEEILLIHDSLSFVVDINLDENADYKVCIYEDASKLIYNDESLEKALPKPWESEKNIWLFLQDHQGPKWRKLIRKNHRIQEVWNQRTMLTVPL